MRCEPSTGDSSDGLGDVLVLSPMVLSWVDG